jgi:MYXO-CTERM domain-containing protein
VTTLPRLPFLVALCGLLACAGDSPPRAGPPVPTLSTKQPMVCVSGECDADLNPAHDAVVFIVMMTPSGQASCSGTLVADDLVVTAGHCVSDHWGNLNGAVGNYAVWFGDDCAACVTGSCSCTARSVTALERHPSYEHSFGGTGGPLNDVAVLTITGKPSSVTPIPVLPNALAANVQGGTTVEFSGFGVDDPSSTSTGVKLHVSDELIGVCDDPSGCGAGFYSPWTIFYDQQPGGPCYGDSGGPAFVTVGGVEYVVGVTSYGDLNCTSFGVSTNLTHFDDPSADNFVGSYLSAGFPDGHACASSGGCLNHHCANSVCCDAACDQACEVCSVAAGASQDGHCETLGASACGYCGDGIVGPGEKCDGNCPSSCPIGDPCVARVLTGDPGACTSECVDTPITACDSGDGCCPAGCTSGDDYDCGASDCGNGVVEAGETCDGDCPTSCPATDPCVERTLTGEASSCNVQCVDAPVYACTSGDLCCPTGCTNASDSDCSATCGDGHVDPGETCDGDCPTSCPSGDPCDSVKLVGSASTCTAHCQTTAITACVAGDGCCPTGCTFAKDSDCAAPVCGNGVVEQGEICDGNCPTSCPTPAKCFTVQLVGDPSLCNVKCQQTAIKACVYGDGCCPAGCTSTTDSDCVAAVCGNGVVEPGETCDGDCPTACPSTDPCVAFTVTGSAAQCNVLCESSIVTQCKTGDGCCPALCTAATDQDCVSTHSGADASVSPGRSDASTTSPGRSDAGGQDPNGAPRGCGCSAGAGAAGPWAALGALAFALRRRRRAH